MARFTGELVPVGRDRLEDCSIAGGSDWDGVCPWVFTTPEMTARVLCTIAGC